MRRFVPLLIALAFGSASQAGRWACRINSAEPLRPVCYVEEVLWTIAPLEIASGISWKALEKPQPYTGFGVNLESWWAFLEIGFSYWVFSFGGRW